MIEGLIRVVSTFEIHQKLVKRVIISYKDHSDNGREIMPIIKHEKC